MDKKVIQKSRVQGSKRSSRPVEILSGAHSLLATSALSYN
jgi:hypothetical protein